MDYYECCEGGFGGYQGGIGRGGRYSLVNEGYIESETLERLKEGESRHGLIEGALALDLRS